MLTTLLSRITGNQKPVFIYSCLLLLFFTPLANAEIYKWTDENGRTHYGDKPGAESTEVIEYQAGQAEQIEAGRSWQEIQQDQEKVLNYLEEAREERQQVRQEKSNRLQQQKQNCQEAEDYRREYTSAPRYYREGKHGKPEFISQDEIDAEVEKAESYLKKNCQQFKLDGGN